MIHDPVVIKVNMSMSDNPIIRIKDTDCPFNESAKAVLSRNKRKNGIIKEFSVNDGIEINQGEVSIDLEGLNLRAKKYFFEFDGYGNGNIYHITEITMVKTAR